MTLAPLDLTRSSQDQTRAANSQLMPDGVRVPSQINAEGTWTEWLRKVA